MKKILCCVFIIVIQAVNSNLIWDPRNPTFDQRLYENVLNPVLCEEHVKFIRQDPILRLQFLDSGIRMPRGILQGNDLDMGNYHQCLGIHRQLDHSEVQGKYCMIRVPLDQSLKIPGLSLSGIHELEINEIKKKDFNETRLLLNNPLTNLELRLAVCIPKTCSTRQGITSLLFNITEVGFEYQDEFCRLPNDKPWVAADYIAVILFSLIGILSLISTVYDLLIQFVYKHRKVSNSLYITFSIYTNGQKLMNFSSGPDTLHCLDGIRALAMIWVVIGHTFSSENTWSNPVVAFQWLSSFHALWLSSALISVDTFFTLSGLLVVYTTVGKINGKKLLCNLHLFYLNRLLRMFPVLATGVLLEASLFNHVSDGPIWTVSTLADRCRAFWWSTLLHIQNYMNPGMTCIGQSWYLAIDVQLHILSPLVLFWVLGGSKKTAWLAFITAFGFQLMAATVYVFIMEFPSLMFNPVRRDDLLNYMYYYYVNTLTRAQPFMVGMIIGYILATFKGKKVRLSKGQVFFNWTWAIAVLSFVIYCTHPLLQPTWNNQLLDNFYNSFVRQAWALGLGWLIFACVHGYGGPINWLLSLRIWKLPARLSYAMYILHYGLMFVVNSSGTSPVFFSVNSVMFKFLGHFGLVFIVSFVVVLFIDAPCAVLFRKILSKDPKKQPNDVMDPENAKETDKKV